MTLRLHLLSRPQMETSASRQAVFNEIKGKNRLFRLVDEFYSKLGSRMLQPLVLFLYVLKSVTSLGSTDKQSSCAIAVVNFGNEEKAIARVAALVPDMPVRRFSLKRSNLFAAGQIGAILKLCATLPRLWSFLRRLARSYPFMPAARIASAIAYYIRFSQLLEKSPQTTAAIIASNYSPEALGLAAAAHRTGRNVIYVNHAPVPANGPLVPPVLADCAVLYGEAMQRTYERKSRCHAEVALIGQPGATQPMQWRNEIQQVGIFLTALTRADCVERLVSDVRSTHPELRILIRNHPVALLQNDLSAISERFGNVDVTIGNDLGEEINSCDLVFCGNSGVAMNVLRAGRPVAYSDSLDDLAYDYNGFVEQGLVCDAGGWDEQLYSRLQLFYSRPEWREVMESYDATYEAEKSEVERAAAEAIRRYLTPAEYLDEAVSRALSSALRSFPTAT